MKNKTMIYPFDIESAPLLRHNKLIQDYEFTHVVAPNGWGFNGKDASCADDGSNIGIIVDNNFDKALENCDTVFFNDSIIKLDFNKLIYPKIIKAAEKSKNIICAIQLESEIYNRVSNICNKNNKLFRYFGKNCNEFNKPKYEIIHKIDTPIIFVLGTCERTNKFEIQLNLRENLKNMGYNVSQVGSRHYCELFQFNSFPRFMYSSDITESEKIILFNYYIKNIELKENPDVIVIGIPGGTSSITNNITNKFGILAYEISQAITPDAVIMSTLYKNYKSNFIQTISESFKYKFGYNIDCCNITNSFINITNSEHEGFNEFITIDSNFINKKIKKCADNDIPIYNIFNKKDSQQMTRFLVSKLAGYYQCTNI